MPRQLVTCPVCETDQHVRKGLICNHTSDGGLRCSGSHEPIKPKRAPAVVVDPAIREALIAMSYTEARSGQWVKPIGFQAFAYVETTGVWTCWFKPANGDPVERMETKEFRPINMAGSHLYQLKEWEQWTKHNVYTDSHFELGAIDL